MMKVCLTTRVMSLIYKKWKKCQIKIRTVVSTNPTVITTTFVPPLAIISQTSIVQIHNLSTLHPRSSRVGSKSNKLSIKTWQMSSLLKNWTSYLRSAKYRSSKSTTLDFSCSSTTDPKESSKSHAIRPSNHQPKQPKKNRYSNWCLYWRLLLMIRIWGCRIMSSGARYTGMTISWR